jgi:hypothetical protein
LYWEGKDEDGINMNGLKPCRTPPQNSSNGLDASSQLRLIAVNEEA